MSEWALVTGASSRGGAAIACALHARGCNVLIHHSARSQAQALSLVDELNRKRPDSARAWDCELTADLVVPNAVIATKPSIVICNASSYMPSALGDGERAVADFDLHVRANASLLAALKPSLRSVVAVTDIHVDRPAPGHVWYTVGKAALQALVLTLAVEWAPDVRCNVVAPGTLPYPDDWHDDPRTQRIEATILLGRIGRFDELAAAVAFLAVDATYVTGQVLAIDGGRSRYLP
jgi:pteridine reductase